MAVNKTEIENAVKILKRGGLVAMPTETVYGLAADASNPDAVRKIFQAKGRPADHPLIVHIADISELSAWAVDVSDEALLLAARFWPGPLTLILKKAPGVSDLITGGQDTIGVRVPNHPVAQALLKAFGGGVAAPSANRFGRISPTTAMAVEEELGNAVDLILEGGQCEVGVESTIVDVSGETSVILRPGMLSERQIASIVPVSERKINIPRVSGSLESHYSPLTPLRLMKLDEIKIFFQNLPENHGKIGIVSEVCWAGVENVVISLDHDAYAHNLYAILRDLDKKMLDQIIVQTVPPGQEWDAIRDRLQRAAMR